MTRVSGAEVVCRTLQRLGVECVFGLPGTQNVGLFEGLRQTGIRTVVATGELAAGFMANGHARTSGSPGVLFTIPGPGFTWALTAVAEARHDSVPLVLVTVSPEGRRPFALQAIDQEAMVAPLAKAVVRADLPDELAPVVHRAWLLAQEGEPGPVVVEIAHRLIGASIETFESAPGPGTVPSVPAPEALQWEELVASLRRARRPLLLAGQGAAAAAGDLVALAEKLGAPVATSISGRGLIPESHPLAMGVEPAGAGIAALNELTHRADLILVLGWKLSHNGSGGFRLSLPPERTIHVDTGPGVLNANYPARLAVRADVPALLARLITLPLTRGEWNAAELAECRAKARSEPPTAEPVFHGVVPPTAEAFFVALRAALPDDAILSLDSGQHQMMARRWFRVMAPRGLLLPSDFQSMGFGIPAAIGAALAAPGRRAVALVGDGGFAMSGLELSVAVRERIPLTVIVFVDESLGLIRQQQYREFGHEFGTRLTRIDLAAFAEAVGAEHVPLAGDADQVLKQAVQSQAVTIVEVALGDSNALVRMRAEGAARAAIRAMVPEGLLARLKRWIR